MSTDEAALASRLDVRADLHLVVDGVSARISGAGGALQVRTDDAAALSTALLDARQAVGGVTTTVTLAAVTRHLQDAGVSIALVGEKGTVVTVGHGQRSPLNAVLPAAPYVRPGQIRVVVPVAWRALRGSSAWPRVRLGGVISISAITVVVAFARRRSRAG